jgi:sugar (pentulose or hexulose) kinase
LSLLGVDVGTTHCKVGVCDDDGSRFRVSRGATPVGYDSAGLPRYCPEELWLTVVAVIRNVGEQCHLGEVQCVGVASMAEAGLLVDPLSGEPRSEIIPWFDSRSVPQARVIAEADEPSRLFRRSGLHPNFKHGLAKILWLRDRDPAVTHGTVWLSVADYIVFRLTGQMVTDPTLAARTYVYSLEDSAWDDAWIRHFGLVPGNFPRVAPTGEPAGLLLGDAAEQTGLRSGTRVAVAGHDHICASLAVGLVNPGTVVDSVGTAESLLGVLEHPELTERGFDSGLVIVPHVLPNRFCWLGGTRSSGGAVEWISRRLADAPLTTDDSLQMMEEAGGEPTHVLFFPYLRGSGGMHPDDQMRAAFVGLDASHSRAQILKAVLEGTAYESESIRRAAERLAGATIDELIVVGGGASNLTWVQIKADVTGCRCVLPAVEEATALGAALLAGLGGGVLESVGDLLTITDKVQFSGSMVQPDPERHATYRGLYETGYLPVGQALWDVTGGRRPTRGIDG